MGIELPEAMAAKSESFPEFRMGVQRVRVTLRGGAVVDDVMISAGRVVKVLGHDGIPFDAGDVEDVEDRSDW